MTSLALLFMFSLFASTTSVSIFDRQAGPCIEGRCQTDHWCYFDQCLPLPDPATAHGPCIQGTCSSTTFCFRGECYPL